MEPIPLTKSRFKMAMDCPRKLDYARDKSYYDARANDELLASLADGGHQVGELARRMYPGGILISNRVVDHQIQRTSALLTSADITIFEATIAHGNLLVRCDIIEKQGNAVRLIEVKATGYDPSADPMVPKKPKEGDHPIRAGWRPYLYDVAFQAYVLSFAYPAWRVTHYLMLLDKQVKVSVAGLNTLFPVTTRDRGASVSVSVSPRFHIDELVPPILRLVDVTEEVNLLHSHPIDRLGPPLSFPCFVDQVSQTPKKGTSFPVDVGRVCKTCQYYVDPADATDSNKSGWAECMAHHTHAPVTLSRRDTVFGLYRLGDSELMGLLKSQPLAFADVTESALAGYQAKPDSITLAQRRHLQWREAHHRNDNPFILKGSLDNVMAGWRWPLHFIDFETARPALPYHAGRKPYDQILFQFSHHVLTQDGRLDHRTQCIVATPGHASSVPVLRALAAALSGDTGTVLHWWNHEATVLKDIRAQITIDLPPDAADLIKFIDSMVGTDDHAGRLADLGMLVSKTVFFPGTGGSSSIKRVLPAALRLFPTLRSRYGSPIYGTALIPSLNFSNWQWVVANNGAIWDPYELLGQLKIGPDSGILAAGDSDDDSDEFSNFVKNGGAAIIAYDQLQQPELAPSERARLTEELLRYCELDTLAMVMVYQALTRHGLICTKKEIA